MTGPLPIGPMVQRLCSIYAQAPSGSVHWYADARRVVRAMARERGCSVACAAGVVAALSPRQTWGRNIYTASIVLAGDVPSGVFRASLDKARRIVEGARPLDVLSGPKTRAFYRALTGNDMAPVVDTWVLSAVGWTRKVTDRVYDAIARALLLAARRVRLSVVQLQAAVWVAVRGRAT
jgi:hypothetical protein